MSNPEIIKIRGLTFSYSKQGRQVLTIPEWSVVKGERVFLFGASGSGKSTLLNLLSGTLAPTNGNIELLGQPFSVLPSRTRDKIRAKHIGVVFQQFNLIHYMSVMQNIELALYFAGNLNGQRVSEIQTLFGQLQLDHGLLSKPVSELSVGQQQRVAIVRALINQPELLIVDEPTSALDSDARDGFMSLLMAACDANDATLIFVSHDRSLQKYFSATQAITELQGSVESKVC